MILCSLRYCRFPPKYIVNSIHGDGTYGNPLMCGKCMVQRRRWLDSWSTFVEVNDPGLLDISKNEYHEGIELKIYKLTKEQIKILKGMVV